MVPVTSKRPWWFAPVLLSGMVIAMAGLVGLGSLLYSPVRGQIEIGNRSYLVPPGEISVVRQDSSTFIRISPPGKAFHIVHDSSSASEHDSTGIPKIFSVNDGADPSIMYRRYGRSIVVCRRASSPTGGCGTWIDYGGANWSVLFPEVRARDADKFVREATGALQRYDTRHRRLVP